MGGDRLAAGKVTVGLASHWPRVTITGSPATYAQGLEEGDVHSPLVEHCRLYLYLYIILPLYYVVLPAVIERKALQLSLGPQSTH